MEMKNKKSIKINCLSQSSHRRTRLQTEQGFSLVEVLLSMLVLSVGIAGILVLMTSNIKNSITAKNQIIASGLAQEGIELVRNLKDNNPEDFKSSGANYKINGDYRIDVDTSYAAFVPGGDTRLYLPTSGGIYSHASGAGTVATKFHRKIEIANDAVDENVRVVSYVSWNGTGIPATCNVGNKCASVQTVLPD